MLCGNCGREFDGKFCPSCGEPVPVPVVCKSCGTTFEGNFCTNCGAENAPSMEDVCKRLYDKSGNKIDVESLAGAYLSVRELKGYFKRCTEYSTDEIDKISVYIYDNIDGCDYGIIKAATMRDVFTSKANKNNQSLAKLFASIAIGISIVGALFYVFNGLFGLSSTEEPPYTYGQSYAGGAVSDAPSAIEISASNLLDAYDANQIAADRSYKDKELVVTGVLKNIGEDIIGNVYITVGSGDAFGLYSVQCYFSSSEEIDKVARLSSGDSVTVTGTCGGKSLNVLLDSCSLS